MSAETFPDIFSDLPHDSAGEPNDTELDDVTTSQDDFVQEVASSGDSSLPD